MFAFNANAKVEKSEILGSWIQSVSQNGVTLISTYDFHADNTVTQWVFLSCASPKIDIVGDATCAYVFDNDAITFKFSGSDFNFTKLEVEGMTPEQLEAYKRELSKQFNMESKMTNIKVKGNTMTAKSDGQKIELKRK